MEKRAESDRYSERKRDSANNRNEIKREQRAKEIEARRKRGMNGHWTA